ncbi:betaine-aldehyde dehydrogenase family protein [Necator americanus]|uniref:Betaine-aldehyde dehydrogenase family protein n=1 Tax=Necator americanus TaxID=51031 RepID=W2SU26_NECAM|nr:betaine-aldehyde dehydrogenase family protein [Necator americanus]ETN72321.1 betaine-aldehyde dehydrogenase family protein [Necator americanus]
MDETDLNRAEVGDLIFLAKNSTSCAFERAVSDAASSPYYHVGIIVHDNHVVHALPRGVLYQTVIDMVADCEPDRVEIVYVKAKKSAKIRAAKYAEKKIGMPYNDLFSPDCINSDGVESYYCSQLVTEAYHGEIEFPEHKLNFKDENGEILEYWKEYYETRGRPVPQDEPGSHPASIRRAPELEMRLTRHLQKCMLDCKSVTEALHFVGGAQVNFNTGKKFSVVEPRSGKRLADCHAATAEDVSNVVETAFKALPIWSGMSWLERGAVLRKTAELLKKNCEEIAHWECVDNGKPITEARMDVLSCIDTFSQSLVGQHIPLSRDRFAYTKREPLGVVGCIGAWNYPIQTCTWKVAPALACGNAVVYKPSPLAPVSAVLLGQILHMAGLPSGTYNVIQGGAETGSALIQNPLVKKISFTGSVPTGKKIMQGCASRNVKPVTLELGGKSSLIILDDSDIDSAVSGAMMANFYSQGQVCSNASKVLVHRSIVADFVAKLREKTSAMRVGDPLEEDTKVGAHISREHMERVKKYIDGAVADGARIVCGGDAVQVTGLEDGFYLSPCVLTDIRKEMAVYREEIFGAVLLVIPFDTDDEAIDIASDTTMGLAAGVFTKDLARAHSIVDRLHAGNVYVNTFNDVSPFVPFGGYDDSGFGRENGTAAIEHYTQIKSVFVSTAATLPNPF